MFNQIFSKKVVVPFFQFLGVIAIFQWIIFPGLTAADTIVNIFSAIIGFFTILAGFYMVTSWFQKYDSIEETKQIVEPKKKRNPKQAVPKGTDESEPFVKTRKKSVTKKVK